MREGYTVVTANDGEQALEMVERENPDIVLMDVMMPKLSGYAVCERIKQSERTRLTPVVLVTALLEREDKIQGINAGADDFLTKPVDAPRAEGTRPVAGTPEALHRRPGFRRIGDL